MKSVRNLFKNELIKLISQTGMRTVMIIALCFAILVPILGNAIDGNAGDFLFGTIGGAEGQYDLYVLQSKVNLSAAEQIKDVEGYEEEFNIYMLDAEYFSTNAEALNFFIDRDLGDSWRYRKFANDYIESSLRVRAYELVTSGEYSYKELYNSYFYDYVFYGPGIEEFYYITYTYGNEKDEFGEYELIEIEKFIAEAEPDFEALLRDEKINISELEKTIVETTAAELLSVTRDSYAAGVESAENRIVELESLIASEYNTAKLNEYQSMLNTQKGILFEKKQSLDGYNFLIDNDYDFDSWQYTTVSQVIPLVAASYAHNIISWEQYAEGYGGESKADRGRYDRYVAECNALNERVEHDLEIINYSLEHEIPLPDALDASYKQCWKDNVAFVVTIVAILGMVIAAGIVASEFSSGTIRLLLVRPKKRWKILLSKLLALFACIIGLLIVLYLIMFFVNLVTGGVSDMLVPDLVYSFGRIWEIPSFLSVLFYMFVAFIPSVVFICIAFMMSAATRSNPLSISIPIVCYYMLSVTSIFAQAIRAFGGTFVDYTPLMYTDLTAFHQTMSNLYSGSIFGTVSPVVFLPEWLGIIEWLLLGALALFFAFLAFNKREIKN